MVYQIFLKSDLGEYQASMDPALVVASNVETQLTNNLFKENGLVLSSEGILEDLINFLIDSQSSVERISKKGKGKAEDNFVKYGAALVRECMQSQNNQLAFRLVQMLFQHELSLHLEPSQLTQDLSSNCTALLLESLLVSKYSDYQLAFGFMLSVNKDKANRLFKDAIAILSKDYPRLQRVARIGSMVGSVWNQRNFQVNCQDLVQHARWMQELTILEIPFDDGALRGSSNFGGPAVKKLVPHLLFKTSGDLETALEFARQYRIEGNCFNDI